MLCGYLRLYIHFRQREERDMQDVRDEGCSGGGEAEWTGGQAWCWGRERGLMEMAEGRGEIMQGGKEKKRLCFWGRMEDKRDKIIWKCGLGSLPSLMKRCQNVFGSHCLHYCPQSQIPSGTICHKNPSSVFLAESLTLRLSLTATGPLPCPGNMDFIQRWG